MAPEDILDRMACQLSILDSRGEDEITLETSLRRHLLMDEGDLEVLVRQVEEEFEISLQDEEIEWFKMDDVVQTVATKLGIQLEESPFATRPSGPRDGKSRGRSREDT